MELKKADSKGRVTGFTPGTLYHVIRSETGKSVALQALELEVPDPEKYILDMVSRDRVIGDI